MSTETQHSRDFDQSKLYMWRTIIAIAHADGNVCEDERAYLEGVIDRMKESAGLGDKGYSTLRGDLTKAQNAIEMLAKVKDERYRGQILYFAHLLAGKDGTVCAAEQSLIDQLETEIGKDINVGPIGVQAREDLLEALDEDVQTAKGNWGAMFERFLVSVGL